MYNKKVLNKATANLDKAKAPARKQDMIVDPMGQWKYPGQNTRIPGGNITMQGVPYPVWAQPNVGPGMLMQPGQNYQFPGADYVDEFPMARRGGAFPKLPNKKNSKAYSRSLTATNKLFAQNVLTASRKKKIFDPNSKYYQDGGENSVVCTDDGRCEETDKVQDMLDRGSMIPTKNLNVMWDVAESQWDNPGRVGDADKEWKKRGVNSLGSRLGMDDPHNCMWATGSGYQCLPETKGKIPLTPFESNDKFISAVNKGTIPFSRVDVTHDPNFDAQEKGILRKGDILNFKGSGNSHAMTFSHYREDGTPIYLDSNGEAADFGANPGLWNTLRPNQNKVTYISRFNPEKFYEKDIRALEEKARTNPTYVQEESDNTVGKLPFRPLTNVMAQGGIPTLPLNTNRQLLRDWVYGADIGMLQEANGGYLEADLTDEEIEEYRKGGYVVEDISVPQLTQAQKGITISDPKKYAYRKAAYDDSLSLYNASNEFLKALKNPNYSSKNKPNYSLGNLQGKNQGWGPLMLPGNPYENINPVKTFTYMQGNQPWRVSNYKKPVQPIYKGSNIIKTIEKEPLPKVGKLPTKKLPQVQTPEIIPSNYNYTPQEPETIRTASRSQTVMEPDPNREGKFKVKELRQVPYSANFPGEGWEEMNAPRVMYYNPTTKKETEERFKQGGYIDAELTPEEIDWYRSQGYQIEDID